MAGHPGWRDGLHSPPGSLSPLNAAVRRLSDEGCLMNQDVFKMQYRCGPDSTCAALKVAASLHDHVAL